MHTLHTTMTLAKLHPAPTAATIIATSRPHPLVALYTHTLASPYLADPPARTQAQPSAELVRKRGGRDTRPRSPQRPRPRPRPLCAVLLKQLRPLKARDAWNLSVTPWCASRHCLVFLMPAQPGDPSCCLS